MKCNPDKYREEFKAYGLTKAQEDETILALWEIMRMFVELGHGIESINNIFPGIFEKTDQQPEDLQE